MEKHLKRVCTNLLQLCLVTRFVAHSVTYGMDLIIDINTDVYPLLGTDRFSLALASTLYKDNRPDPGVYTNYSNEVRIYNSWLIV